MQSNHKQSAAAHRSKNLLSELMTEVASGGHTIEILEWEWQFWVKYVVWLEERSREGSRIAAREYHSVWSRLKISITEAHDSKRYRQ